MGKVTGFLEIDRRESKYQPASDRIRHFREFVLPMDEKDVREQASRCMDCGIPYCHGPSGCPVHNQIPDWNDLVWQEDWQLALDNLHSTNNFPEFTGRVCPAPCEEACTLNLEDSPVAIKTVEQAIADVGLDAFSRQWPDKLSGGQRQRVAIARALATKPKLVIADEPTGNVDEEMGDRLYRLFRELNKRLNTTVLIATHDLAMVRKAKMDVLRLKQLH